MTQQLDTEKREIAEEKATLAEDKVTFAEDKATFAEDKATFAEEKAKLAEDKAKLRDEKMELADEKDKIVNILRTTLFRVSNDSNQNPCGLFTTPSAVSQETEDFEHLADFVASEALADIFLDEGDEDDEEDEQQDSGQLQDDTKLVRYNNPYAFFNEKGEPPRGLEESAPPEIKKKRGRPKKVRIYDTTPFNPDELDPTKVADMESEGTTSIDLSFRLEKLSRTPGQSR